MQFHFYEGDNRRIIKKGIKKLKKGFRNGSEERVYRVVPYLDLPSYLASDLEKLI